MISRALIVLIRFYQYFISPLKASSCRFYPTCSSYAVEAIKRYGPFYGLVKAICRICRCHPWHPGGFDPVR